MRPEIFLKHDEKERLLARASRKSLAHSVLNKAQPKSNQPQLVTISCDERAAAALLEVAQRHYGSTSRVNEEPDEKVGTVEVSSSREITLIERVRFGSYGVAVRLYILEPSSSRLPTSSLIKLYLALLHRIIFGRSSIADRS
jgi:hypothetical protein